MDRFFRRYLPYEISEEDFKNFLRSKMIIEEDRDKWQSAYNFMQFANPYHVINGTREYLFFTKPDLNIMKDEKNLQDVLANNSFWKEMLRYYRDDLACLQKRSSCKRSGELIDSHPFIPLLSNSVASPLSLPSIDADTVETASTIYGTSIQYRGDSMKSDEGHDFNIEFIDSKQLEVYYFFKMWDEYEKLKKQGIIGPPMFIDSKGKQNDLYRVYRILHDQIAIYRFLVDADDMSTIIHYSKLIGCFPKSVPRDSFDSLEGEIKYSISWHAQWVYDSDPIILYEFNQVCNKFFGSKGPMKSKYIDLYDKDLDVVNGSWRPHPYIVKVDNQVNPLRAGATYRLAWFDK